MQIVSRSEWGARSPRSAPISKNLNRASTLHWNGPTVTINGSVTWDHGYCAALVRGIQNYHMGGHGWNDIAYNFLVCPHGLLYVGRGLNIINAANGTNEDNQTSHAICSLGGESNPFSNEEKIAIKEWVEFVSKNTTAPNACVGHRDHKATSCPGDARYNWVHSGMPIDGGIPTPTPPVNEEISRIKHLQNLIGVPSDGVFGPVTDAAINRNLIGWHKNLPGNGKPQLVAHLQAQGNRKFNDGMAVDGIVGPATNHLIVVQLGQTDGVAGPKAWRLALK